MLSSKLYSRGCAFYQAQKLIKYFKNRMIVIAIIQNMLYVGVRKCIALNDLTLFPQKSKHKSCCEREHSNRAVKYIDVTKLRARKEITNSLL